ncbi:MAG: hypothetical protein WAN14_07280, partial [Candidatus Acidiferrales bacterium]
STQQIMHPDMYLQGVKPEAVTLPEWKGVVPGDWKLLEENTMGEFGFEEVLKQFLDEKRADLLGPAWKGDRYATFEDAKKEHPLVFRLTLDNADDAGEFFKQYSEALAVKYEKRTAVFRGANFLQFQSADGGVFLRCVQSACMTVESASRETFDKIDAAIGWGPAPVAGE